MIKNNKMYIKTPSQTVGPFFGNYLNFNLSKKTYTNFNEKINRQIIIKHTQPLSLEQTLLLILPY